jgi:hypothetical protein
VFLTDPVTLADDGAVTAFQEKSNIERFGRTRFEDNPSFESVSLGLCRRMKVLRYAGHQDELGPRNLIEEFDPGSA